MPKITRNKKPTIVLFSDSDSSDLDMKREDSKIPEGDSSMDEMTELQAISNSEASTRTMLTSPEMSSRRDMSERELLSELLRVTVQNQKLYKDFLSRQEVIITLLSRLNKKKTVDRASSVVPDTSSDSDSELIPEQYLSSILAERKPSNVVTKSCYMVWGVEELADRAVRTQTNVIQRPLTPTKKRVVKKIFLKWLKKERYSEEDRREEILKLNKYFNGAITAARKRTNNRGLTKA